MDLEVRHDGGRRHEVVHERRRQVLTVVPVRRVLEQDRTDRLGDTAADLALHDRGVDRQPAVLDHHVAVDADEPRLDVDLDLGHVGAARPAALASVVLAGHHEIGVGSLRQSRRLLRHDAGELAQR